jgi:signal transduction histidine kinase
VAAFGTEWSRQGLEPALWWRFVILGQFVVVAVLPIAGWLVRRFVHGAVARGLMIITAMALVIVVRGLLMHHGAVLLGVLNQLDLTPFIASVIMQTGLLALVGVRVSQRKAEQKELLSLAGEREAREAENAQLQVRVAETSERVAVQVGMAVEPRRRVIDEQLVQAERSGDVAPVIESLHTFVDRDLIPLSHRLADRSTPWSSQRADQNPDPARARELTPLRLPGGDLLRPGLVMFVVALLTVGSTAIRLPMWSAVAVTVFLTALIGALLFLVRAVISRWPWPTPLAFIVTPVVIAVVFAVAVRLVLLTAGVSDLRSVAIIAAVGGFFGVLTALATLTDVRFRTTRQMLTGRIDELQDATSRARQELWLSRRRFGYALHGGLQAAVHAASMRLATVSAGDGAAIAAVRAELRTAFDRVRQAAATPTSLDVVCAEIASTWRGTCAVEWHISDQVARVLVGDPTANACSAEIVLETVQNAVRHGRAEHVIVNVDVETDAQHLVIDVTDDGEWKANIDGDGLGSRMLDEFCSRWRRDALVSGTHVRAELALAPS